jgi:TetR/AcrR family transcriptional regulator, transcriptional repressor for nem operon
LVEVVVGVSKEQTAQNRRAIIAAAGRLFRERGVDGVGLSELMSHAGFTQGGFYNHFASKEALIAEVVAAAMVEGGQDFAERQRRPLSSTKNPLQRHIDYYLSEGHRDDIDHGCPVAGFAGNAPRFGDEARANYAAGVAAMIDMIEGLIIASGGRRKPRTALREQATRVYCEMLGALTLSRTVREAAPDLARRILDACRRGLADS